MRDLLRTRKQMVRERTGHIQRIQKTLEDANIKLDSVVADILGLSGRRILGALIDGQTMPQALATLAHRRIHATIDELEAALRGRVTRHHRFLLKLHLDQIDAFDAAIARIDEEVGANVEPFRGAIELLSTIPGISRLSAQVLVSEIGIDMSRFETAGHLVSWAGLCPRNDESAGKRRSTKMKGRARAENYAGPMRLGSRTQEKQLFASSVPASALTARLQESHLRRCRFHAYRRLPYA
jgi:transposase